MRSTASRSTRASTKQQRRALRDRTAMVFQHPRDPRTTSFMQEAGFMAAELGAAAPGL